MLMVITCVAANNNCVLVNMATGQKMPFRAATQSDAPPGSVRPMEKSYDIIINQLIYYRECDLTPFFVTSVINTYDKIRKTIGEN